MPEKPCELRVSLIVFSEQILQPFNNVFSLSLTTSNNYTQVHLFYFPHNKIMLLWQISDQAQQILGPIYHPFRKFVFLTTNVPSECARYSVCATITRYLCFGQVSVFFLWPLKPSPGVCCLCFSKDFEFLAYPLNQYIFLFDGCSMSMGCKLEMSYINIVSKNLFLYCKF